MQRFTSTSRRHAGANGVQTTAAERLAAIYRARKFEVQALALPDDARANLPDAILMLHQGRDHVLVHAYARVHGPLPQGAVRQLAMDAFEAGATRSVLIGAAGFTVAAYQAALHHNQLALVEEHDLSLSLEAAAPAVQPLPVEVPVLSLREATRPAWPLRAVIGLGGMAMAVTMLFVTMPVLQRPVMGLLRPAATPGAAFAQAAIEPWRGPSSARSGELELQAAIESGSPSRQAAVVTAAGLPANFNQALAPHL
ncbi:Restriction endonuclease [Pseudoxanthomonas sp. GM95]|uniref:restriction endonuclease n=1 Tax=Pseudoxanthomonas sp. GM95 TaxID=1881043 RepID=UPI0008BBCBA7|nr:restriction endonuclease [Pseudoxanthomonas sp. GM95]SEL85203.1 Restriction endonuclease [Pseudoxanthomonas sp. GM95]